MKKSLALLTVILLLAMLPTGCKSSEVLDGCPTATATIEPTMTSFETPEATLSPTATATPSETAELPETVVSAFIEAQDEGDWDSFVSLWTTEEQRYYRDFFAYKDNETERNGYFAIQSAQTIGLYEIKDFAKMLADFSVSSLPFDVADGFNFYDTLERYLDVKLIIAKADYHLSREFWDYREGVNYRVLVLVPENGEWRVIQDYQGYPSAGSYFGDTIEEPEETEETYPEETPNTLVDGTVHGTDSMTGYYIDTSEGDYVHVGIRTIEGEEIWFWLGGSCEIDPYTLSRYQKIQVTWENRDTYIEEAEEVINMDVITEIKILK